MSWDNKSVDNGFVHSVKVPRIYKTASSIVKRVVESGESLKQLIYSTRHKNVKGVYALVVETIKHSKDLDRIIKKSKLLENESRLEPWLARVLVTEMLYRGKELKGDSKPVKTVLIYKDTLTKHLGEKGNRTTKIEVTKPRYVRVNTIQHTPDEVVKLFRDNGWNFLPPSPDYDTFLKTVSQMKHDEFTKDFHIKELLVFPSSAQFYKNELYINGGIILQDKASCLPVFLLKPRPNSTVLDMCAAPGMKTTHLSAKMKNKGTVYAVERNSSRYNTLCDFVKKVGCKNVHPLHLDALSIGKSDTEDDNINTNWYKDVEYILVDPSCSGTGMVERRNIFVDEKYDKERIQRLCAFQFKVLLHALTQFPNAKRVVYSTCSLLTEENEKVVEDVLRKLSQCEEFRENGKNENGKFEIVDALKDDWVRRGSDNFEFGKCCLYSDPEKDYTNGFFIAVFERCQL